MSGQQHAPTALYHRDKPGTHFTGGCVGPRAGLDGRKFSSPIRIRSPDRPARSQSLYRLSYPTHSSVITFAYLFPYKPRLSQTSEYWCARECYGLVPSWETDVQYHTGCSYKLQPSTLFVFIFSKYQYVVWTAVAQWLSCCATNRKVAGSILDGVIRNFIDIKSFRSHYDTGVDSASDRNEYQEYFLGVNAAGA